MSDEHPTVEGDQGLRARKRNAAVTAIQKVALRLAFERGFDNVTVEQICAESMISQRTFFNYFGSKEGVILGLAPPTPDEAQREAFVRSPGPDVLGDLVRMIGETLAARNPDAELMRTRRRVILSTPELLNRQTARMTEIEDGLIRTIMRRFESNDRTLDETPDLEDEARMMVSLAVSMVRYMARIWFTGDYPGTQRELLEHSIALIRRITNADVPPRSRPGEPVMDQVPPS